MGRQIFTIFGATGNQGNSVLKTGLSVPSLASKYQFRAVTRDKNSSKSLALAKLGVEVVEADMGRPETIKAAVAGSSIVFGVTTAVYDVESNQTEAKHGKAIVDGCVATIDTLELLVFSTLPSKADLDRAAGKGSNISIIGHFENKARVEAYAREKLPGKSTFVAAGFFLDNFINLFRPNEDDNGNLVLTVPITDDAEMPIFTPSDMGKYVFSLIQAEPRSSIVGKRWLASSGLVTTRQLAKASESCFGGKVELKYIPVKEWEKNTPLLQVAAEELGRNMDLINSPGYYGSAKAARDAIDEFRPLIEKSGLGPLTTPEAFFKAKKVEI